MRTTARMAAFIPGASPPVVITPIFFSRCPSKFCEKSFEERKYADYKYDTFVKTAFG